ncbi:coatamer subunit protein [Colletotrichum graminicola]|uniref:Coatamer subunit protein n=1 Tax=Colletotrichum graminicola (strain M1.001 / M2 / FGSC 10212) TaxID=645133 RepID=E3QRT2_COLGM|nr:coatamer subunit protein [Colletotrichum graminicola M1.001]EFQ33570.1 coatamer subunit protein [Colletotrichum graminicola M1.001]WDK22223.1 coatamer subunit protein [Colletotrichum graminicola]
MSSAKDLVEFPDVEAKLQKPSKQSAFERQRAEAEAKKAREAAETAAVYQDFVKSFDHDDEDNPTTGRFGSMSSQRPPPKAPGFGGAPLGAAAASKRHFGASALKSGPGSLGPVSSFKSGPGSLGPPPGSLGRKRGFDAFRQEKDRDGRLGFEEREEPMSVAKVFNNSDDEDEANPDSRVEEMAVARPTLRLSQLPPGTSPAFIKSLIPTNLTVDNVKILPPVGPSGTERKCAVAIVTLSQDTPATDIDAAVSSLQNRYLGYGFNLSLHRHLSSTVATATASALGSTSAGSQPFGAKPVSQQTTPGNATTQHAFHRGFAPPTSYAPNLGGPINRSSILHVPVKPPNDVKMVQLINKTIESVLEHGVEFEALLMSRPEVQREEKWAWIWDARSEGGIWYRWRLWEIVTGASSRSNKGRYLPLFDGSHAWKAPEKGLPYEFATNVDEFVSDSEYNSSDDEDFDGDNRENQTQGPEAEATFLNPLDKAKLTHLLSRLPTTLSKIRKGDIARVTAFALTHASRGAEEVVDMIVSNVERPFALTAANPDFHSSIKDKGKQADGSELPAAEPEEKTDKEGPDTSGASLVGLYVVSDVLSASSSSGIQRAWRYRQVFEGVLKERRIFEHLGLMAERLNWGRMRAEKWKRSVGLVLGLWEGWCVFPTESQELFASSFDNPPSLKTQEQIEDEAAKKGRWKPVETSTPSANVATTKTSDQKASEPTSADKDDDVEGEPMDEEDVAGEPMEEEDVMGEPMSEEDVEGEPMVDDDVEGEPMEEDAREPVEDQPGPAESSKVGGVAEGAEAGETRTIGRLQLQTTAKAQTRKRMRAVDMFADSGDSDESK